MSCFGENPHKTRGKTFERGKTLTLGLLPITLFSGTVWVVDLDKLYRGVFYTSDHTKNESYIDTKRWN